MPNNLIPGPMDDDEMRDELDIDPECINDGSPEPEPKRRSRKSSIPSIEQCLRALSTLPGLLAMGAITTAMANSIRGTYEAILRHHRQGTSSISTQIPPSLNLGLILLQHPELATILEPILSREQIEQLMRDAQDTDK